MKNQIYLLLLIVTICYCQKETTDSDQQTAENSNNAYQATKQTEETAEAKTTTVRTTAKTSITTKIQTTTQVTPIGENPILGKMPPDFLRLVNDLLPHLLPKPDMVKSLEENKPVI